MLLLQLAADDVPVRYAYSLPYRLGVCAGTFPWATDLYLRGCRRAGLAGIAQSALYVCVCVGEFHTRTLLASFVAGLHSSITQKGAGAVFITHGASTYVRGLRALRSC